MNATEPQDFSAPTTQTPANLQRWHDALAAALAQSRQPHSTKYRPIRRRTTNTPAIRNRVCCCDCGIVLSKFRDSVDPPSICCQTEENGVQRYWCAPCTKELDKLYERQHASRVAAARIREFVRSGNR